MLIDNYNNLKYQFICNISEGGFGSVSKYQRISDKRIFAVKELKGNIFKNGMPSFAIRELSLLSNINNKYLIKLEGIIVANGKLYIITEFFNQSLDKYYLQHKNIYFTEAQIKVIIYQILLALNYLHSNKIMHRDIKLENILCDSIDTLNIKIADFGLSRVCLLPMREYTPNVGTFIYASPEIIFDYNEYSFEIDIWCLGICFYFLAKNEYLFKATCYLEFVVEIARVLGTEEYLNAGELKNCENFVHDMIKFESNFIRNNLVGIINNDGIKLIESMMRMDPLNRISAREALESPWFNNINKDYYR